jgi:hypothetical protein
MVTWGEQGWGGGVGVGGCRGGKKQVGWERKLSKCKALGGSMQLLGTRQVGTQHVEGQQGTVSITGSGTGGLS